MTKESGATQIELRALRLERAKQIIRAMGPTPINKLTATLSVNLGVQETKAKEYVRMLLHLQFIMISVEGTEKIVKIVPTVNVG
jgi:hypothetical protein